MKKNLVRVITGAMIVSMMGTGFAFTNVSSVLASTPAVSAKLEASTTMDKSISVTGTGTMKVDPDVAYVQLGVTTQKNTSKEARSENAKTIATIRKALIKAGVKDEDIQTQYLNAYSTYDYSAPSATLVPAESTSMSTICVVSNQLKISVRDLNKLGSIVNSALDAGATDFNGVDYAIEDSDKYYDQLVDEAMKSANNKAKLIAKASGMTLGSIVSAYDQTFSDNYTVNLNSGMVSAISLDGSGTSKAEKDNNIGDTLRPEKVTISVQLSVIYSAK